MLEKHSRQNADTVVNQHVSTGATNSTSVDRDHLLHVQRSACELLAYRPVAPDEVERTEDVGPLWIPPIIDSNKAVKTYATEPSAGSKENKFGDAVQTALVGPAIAAALLGTFAAAQWWENRKGKKK